MIPSRSCPPAQLMPARGCHFIGGAAMRAVLFWALALLSFLGRLAAAQTSLRFNGDVLRIVQLTDLHVGEGPADADTLQVRRLSALVFLEAPLHWEALLLHESRGRSYLPALQQ